MSKKKLLNEATVRKFMKLANLSNLSSGFIKEMAHPAMEEDLYQEELYEEEGDEMDLELVDDEPEGELDMELAPEGDAGVEGAVRDILAAVAAEAEKHGVEVELEDDAAPADEPEMDLDDEPAPEGDEGGEEDMMAEAIMNLLDRSGIQVVDDQAITESMVKKVAARVARRLLKESL